MDLNNVRSTFYLDPTLHHALRLKAASTHRSMSDIVNDAIREALREDEADLAAVDEDLRGIAKADVKRIVARINELSDEPRPAGAEKLAGHDLYRTRQGVFRIVYRIEDAAIVVEVIMVAHRREV